MKSIPVSVWIAGLAFPLICSAPGFAREPASAPTAVADTSATRAPTAASRPPSLSIIPTEEISRAAARTEIRLRTLHASTRRGAVVQEIAERLPDVQSSITTLAERTQPEMLENQSRRYLRNLVSEWGLWGPAVSEWEAYLSARLETLAAARKELQESASLWEASEQAARRSGAPASVVDRAAATHRAIVAEEATLRADLDEALELENSVSELDLIVSDSEALIAGELRKRRTALFRLDGPVFWEWHLGGNVATLRERGGLRLALDFGRTMRDFTVTHAARIRLHLLLALVTAFLVAWLYRRRPAWRGAEPETEFFARLLGRPVATGALLVLVVLTPLVYPTAPISVYQVSALLAAPFLARLLPRLLPAPYVRAGYVVVGLYVVEPLPDLLGSLAGYSSLLLLIEIVAALALAFALDRDRARHGAAISIGIRLASVLLGVALFGVLLGARSLAGLLFTGTVRAAYTGVLLFAAVVVVQGLWGLFLRSRALRWVHAIQLRRTALQAGGSRLFAIVGLLWWAGVTLENFYLGSVIGNGIREFVQHRWHIGSLNIAVGDILLFIVVLWISVLLSRLVRSLLDDDVFPRLSLARGVPATISTMVRYGVIALGFAAALAAARIPLDRLTVLAGALGVGIGFGLQNIVNNFVSGLILVFERPVQVGDTVEVANYLGRIERIGVRASMIRTYDGAEVLIPNGALISNDVVNWTLSDRTRRIEIEVGVVYGTDPSKVLSLLIEVAAAHPSAMTHPAPQALFKGFGDSSLDFLLRFWTNDFDEWMQIKSQVTVAVYQGLNEAGIEIPFPQRDLHLRTVDPRAADALRPGKAGRAPGDSERDQR